MEADVTVAGELSADSIAVSGIDLDQLIQSVLKETLKKKGD